MKTLGISLIACVCLSITQPILASEPTTPTETVFYGTFKTAKKTYDAGDLELAIQQFDYLAKQGNSQAQYWLGHIYTSDKDNRESVIQGYAWLKLSDAGKELPSELAVTVAESLSEQEKQQAENLYRDFYDRFGMEKRLQELLSSSPLRKKSNHKQSQGGPKCIRQCTKPAYPVKANLNGVEGFVQVEITLDTHGKPTSIEAIESEPSGVFEKSTIKAIEKWTFDVSTYDITKPLTYKMEFTLSKEPLLPRNWLPPGFTVTIGEDKLKVYKEKAEVGSAASQYMYATYEQSNIDRASWYQKSAEQGFAKAQYELGMILVRGKGCRLHSENRGGRYAAGRSFHKTESCIVDLEQGFNWLFKAAANNNSKAQVEIAEQYRERGELDKAHYWFRKVIDRKDPKVSWKVAVLLEENLEELNSDGIERFSIDDIWQLLLTVEKKYQPTRTSYSGFLAKVAYQKGLHQEAVNFQEKANETIRENTGHIPDTMKKNLKSIKTL